ncbi:hypothetical protein NQ317_018032 [Molorchus minor]|uniref:DDE Tnp4 domain-containing protein n=1 Tax=Molorchus minor TaxID=1323400 RepID=A0ABQ9JT53_9CUCU|nr:hypothetical protein NQ317_018032 [Molorchus minor]
MDVEDDIFEDDLDLLEIIEFGFPRQMFRLYKDTAQHLLILIEDDLQYPNNLNNAVSPMNQLLTALRLFSTGGHLSTVADYMQMDISTVSRIVVRVSEAIARLSPQYIRMPENGRFIEEQTKFYEIARFPKVIAVVDGTHIKIQSPGGEDAEIFRNRKSYFSVNTQVACNADLKFLNIVARWPGSSHDSTIFNNSDLMAQFEQRHFPNCYILGDSGYPLRNYFFTPLLNPNWPAQQLYNESHIRTRNTIERAIGVWKRRFPIMAYGARLKLETILTIIVATAVLHNITIEMNEPEPPPADEIDIDELNYLIEIGQIPEQIANNVNAIPRHVQQIIIVKNLFI